MTNLNRIKELMGVKILTEQQVNTGKEETIEKKFGNSLYPPNSANVDYESNAWKELSQFITQTFIKNKYSPRLIEINSSASTLRNTGEAENLTHLQLSQKRAETLKSAILNAYGELFQGVEFVINPKGENGDGTSGPKDVFGTGSQAGPAVPQEILKAKEAGDSQTITNFYNQYQYTDIKFIGRKEGTKTITEQTYEIYVTSNSLTSAGFYASTSKEKILNFIKGGSMNSNQLNSLTSDPNNVQANHASIVNFEGGDANAPVGDFYKKWKDVNPASISLGNALFFTRNMAGIVKLKVSSSAKLPDDMVLDGGSSQEIDQTRTLTVRDSNLILKVIGYGWIKYGIKEFSDADADAMIQATSQITTAQK